MGEEERTAIAETIVEIDRAIVHVSLAEQERMMRRRLALMAVLRTDGENRADRANGDSQRRW
jgi:hypothetical protein